ncbi:MAG: DUF2790 domain-containing protein [Pseudomonas sp.]
MKAALLLVAISGICTSAMAATVLDSPTRVPVEQYAYSTHLDIAKVVWMSTIPRSCEVVPARIDYIDSKGQEHLLEYQVMGNGCVDG